MGSMRGLHAIRPGFSRTPNSVRSDAACTLSLLIINPRALARSRRCLIRRIDSAASAVRHHSRNTDHRGKMRIVSSLIVASSMLATPVLADCPDQRMVFQPASGKLGFRMEIVQAEGGAKAL